jgi:hypothetical protein
MSLAFIIALIFGQVLLGSGIGAYFGARMAAARLEAPIGAIVDETLEETAAGEGFHGYPLGL